MAISLPTSNVWRNPGAGLLDIGENVAVRQHGPLGNPCRAARVLCVMSVCFLRRDGRKTVMLLIAKASRKLTQFGRLNSGTIFFT